MKNTGTTQQDQGQVSALAEPKDEEQSFRDKDKIIEGLLGVVPYTPRFQKEILTEALGRVNAVTAKIDELAKMEPLVRRIYEGLDIKTKALICVLQKINAAEGVTNDITYGGDILHNLYKDKSVVERAAEQLPGDVDIAILAEVFGLAFFVSSEGKVGPSGTTETTDKESIVDKPKADVVVNEVSNDEDPADIVRRWLLGQSYITKLACTILSGYGVGDHNTEKIVDEVYKQYRNEIAAKVKNRDESLSFEETLMTGIAAELEVWRDRF